MLITIRESMLVRKCLNNYVLENNLEYDKSPLIMGIMDKLKELEKENVLISILNEETSKLKDNEKIDSKFMYKVVVKSQAHNRNELKKELKKYSIQTKCNRKILELDKLERVETKNKLSRVVWKEAIINKGSK